MKKLIVLFASLFSGSLFASAEDLSFHLEYFNQNSQGVEVNVPRFPDEAESEQIHIRLPFPLLRVQTNRDQSLAQGEVAILGSHNPETESLFTLNLLPCIALIIRNPENGFSLLAHISGYNHLESLIPFFEALHVANPAQLQVTLYSTSNAPELSASNEEEQKNRFEEIVDFIRYNFEIPMTSIRAILNTTRIINFEWGFSQIANHSIGINRQGEIFHTAAINYFSLETLLTVRPNEEEEIRLSNGVELLLRIGRISSRQVISFENFVYTNLLQRHVAYMRQRQNSHLRTETGFPLFG